MAIFKGEEKKLAINLTAPGFSMDDDDFEISVASNKVTITGIKGNPDPTAKVRIFKEDSASSTSDSSSSSSSSEEPSGEWFIIVDTSALTTGPLRIIAKAYIKDPNAADLVRTEIAVANWDTLTNP